MRKILSMCMLAALFICGSVFTKVKADVITNADQLSNAKAYTITSKRGAWTINTAKDKIVSSHTSGGSTANPNASTEEGANKFAICQYDGNYYIYSLFTKKFFAVSINTGVTNISSGVGAPIKFETTGDATYPLKAGSVTETLYANNNNSGGIFLDSWTYTDDGNKIAIEEVGDLTSEETSEINAALDASLMNKHRAYIIAAERGTWCANAAGTSLATTSTNTSPATGYNQFALFVLDNKYYIYNVGTKKSIKKSGALAEGRGDVVGIRLSGNATYPYMLFFIDGNIFFNMQGGGGSYAMNTYSSPDAGNRQSLSVVAGVDPFDDATTEYNRTVNVTYNLMYQGEKVGTKTVNEPLGQNAALPSDIDKGCFTYTYSPTYNQTDKTTITVNATPIFTISPDYVGATWYNMYIRQNNRWIPYSETEEPYKPYDATADDKKTKALQWAFVGNPFTTGIKVINRAAGRGKSLKKDGNNAVMRDGDTYWDLFGRAGGILLREQGTTDNLINQAGSANGYLQFWNSGSAWNDNGSTIWLVEAPVETTTITYNVKYLNELVATATATAVIDDPTPLTLLPSSIVRDFVKLTGDDTHNVVANDVIELTAEWENAPFELNTSYASIAKWYDMSIRNTWYVTSDNKDGDGALKTVNANALGLGEDAYQWAFVGDPYHIKLYNKAEGSTKAFAWTAVANQNIPAFVDASTANVWCVRKSTNSDATTYGNGFLLTIPENHWQINQYGGAGGSLKVWNSDGTHDAGSIFKVFDVPTDFAEYAVAEIFPYLDGEYFVLTDALKTQIGWQDSYATTCPFNDYKNMKQALAAIDLSNIDNYKFPETGYYRIKSKYYPGRYMTYKTYNNSHYIGTEENNMSATSIVKLTALGNYKYNISLEDRYASAPAQSARIGLVENPVEFTAAVAGSGAGTFTTGEQYGAVHCAGTIDYFCVGWTADAAASQWKIEDATTIDITMHEGDAGEFWATLNVPFDISLPDGTNAYVGTRVDNTIELHNVGTNVPANTPVVLKGTVVTEVGTNKIITATIKKKVTNTAVGLYTNSLSGQNLADTAPDANKLSLGKSNGKVGFYIYDDPLGANKAYLNNSGGGSTSNGFQFVFDDVTGLNNVVNISVDGQLYDLQGRKVVAPAKGGLYIKGGKVVKY